MKNILGQIKGVFLGFLSQNNHDTSCLNTSKNITEESIFQITEEFILNIKLQHLEYINYLESNMTDEKLRFLPLEFLRDLENHKLQSQISTIIKTRELLIKTG